VAEGIIKMVSIQRMAVDARGPPGLVWDLAGAVVGAPRTTTLLTSWMFCVKV
jgi:hypothetical protein